MHPAMSNEPYSNGNEVESPTRSSQFGGATAPPGHEQLLREVDADDALHERRECERQRAGPAAAVECPLGSVEGGEQLLHPRPSASARSSWRGHAISDNLTHRRTPSPLSLPARRSRRRLIGNRA